MLSLSPAEKSKGIITASSGNHGAAFTYASRLFGCQAKLYLPENISPVKLEPIRLYGKGDENIVFYGTDVVETEIVARQEAQGTGGLYISAYNDRAIIGGQGTVAVEIERQLPAVDAVFVPVGGGGLMSGIAGYLKARQPAIEIIGCQPENSPVMAKSVLAGRIIEMESKPTIADGSAGGIEPGSITFDICRSYVDQFVTVTEQEIAQAILLSLEKQQMVIEGAAAMSIAAFLQVKEKYRGKTVVLVISGRKITLEKLKKVLSAEG